jgi:hypothetical protein
MSEPFESALGKVNFGKYIDQIQDELRRAIEEIGPGKTPGEAEAIQSRLQTLIRKQSKDLAKEVGFAGNQSIVFMITTAIISTAWVSFALRRETSNLSKSPEDRLAVMEMFDALTNALGNVVKAGSDYADTYSEAKPSGSKSREKSSS